MPADPHQDVPGLPAAAHGEDEPCWKRIGIWSHAGASCPKLEQHIHCHHCPVFAGAGRRLFDRPVPTALLAERTTELAQIDTSAGERRQSLTVFRLGTEWLALPTRSVAEVVNPTPIHRLPHRSTDVLLGLTAVRGELHLAVSLAALLSLPTDHSLSEDTRAVARMLLLHHDDGHFAFNVDEVPGIFQRHEGSGRTLPATLSGLDRRFIAAATETEDRLVGILDPELVVYGFSKALA